MSNPTQPAVRLTLSPPGPFFAISEAAVMPSVSATAGFVNLALDPHGLPPTFEWSATLLFTGMQCAFGAHRPTSHVAMQQSGPSPRFLVPFSQVRGGDLTISLKVRIGALELSAQTQGLKINGTNPSLAVLHAGAPDNAAFRKLMRHESSLKQFISPACPHFSHDGKGGVGLCQITDPAPSYDEIWNWKANVAAGWRLYQEKERMARAYPATVRNGQEFKALVAAYNDARPVAAQPLWQPAFVGFAETHPASAVQVPLRRAPIPVDLPDFTADQLQRDTLRGFNGYAGGLHEYRVKRDRNGLLVVAEDASGQRGTAEWEPVSAAERSACFDTINLDAKRRGDVNYVDNVLAQADF